MVRRGRGEKKRGSGPRAATPAGDAPRDPLPDAIPEPAHLPVDAAPAAAPGVATLAEGLPPADAPLVALPRPPAQERRQPLVFTVPTAAAEPRAKEKRKGKRNSDDRSGAGFTYSVPAEGKEASADRGELLTASVARLNQAARKAPEAKPPQLEPVKQPSFKQLPDRAESFKQLPDPRAEPFKQLPEPRALEPPKQLPDPRAEPYRTYAGDYAQERWPAAQPRPYLQYGQQRLPDLQRGPWQPQQLPELGQYPQPQQLPELGQYPQPQQLQPQPLQYRPQLPELGQYPQPQQYPQQPQPQQLPDLRGDNAAYRSPALPDLQTQAAFYYQPRQQTQADARGWAQGAEPPPRPAPGLQGIVLPSEELERRCGRQAAAPASDEDQAAALRRALFASSTIAPDRPAVPRQVQRAEKAEKPDVPWGDRACSPAASDCTVATTALAPGDARLAPLLA